ncbi:apolipoprotein N-acyltransferase [Mesorhizobium sp. CAU 1741]|uniref:apolipoprotein N-acyltransferase n=1 Tax=Mesorhizobium sp. CAU 1741 TaxID=3140366 RepID=UPI00325BAF7B
MERLAGKVILLWGWRRALAAFLAGAVAALSQPPFDFFAVGFISFPVLVWLLDGAAGRPGERFVQRLLRPFLIGWWFGFGYFVAGLWWVGNALLVEADAFAWALPLAIFGLPALLAVFYGVATALARLAWSDGAGRIAAIALGFGVAEWLRTFVLTGFPWNAIGQAAMPVPLLMQTVTVIGMVGMNALVVLVFAMPAVLAARRGRIFGLSLAALLMMLHAGFGYYRLSTAQTASEEPLLHVRLVQPSIVQSSKWDAQMRDSIFSTYLDMSRRPQPAGSPPPDLIVWPETAVPFILSERPDALVALGELVEDGQTLMVGAVRMERGSADRSARYYNSVTAINDGGETYDAIDKIRLVPFGEYLPLSGLLSRLGMSRLVESVADFSAGSQRRPITTAGGVTALPFICYEIIFPGIAGHGGEDADLILNITNDAWFGDTPGPYQHFRQAQIRAVEAGRPLVRSANNGISGVVDAYGRTIDAFGMDAIGVLDIAVPRQRLTSAFDPRLAGMGVLVILGLWTILASIRDRRRFD